MLNFPLLIIFTVQNDSMRLIILLLFPFLAIAQQDRIIAGPFQGHSTNEFARYWVMLEDYSNGNQRIPDALSSYILAEKEKLGFKHHQIIKEESVRFGKQYTLKISLEDPVGKEKDGSKDLHFLVGSCYYPHKEKTANKRNVIFNSMKEKSGEFMIWMGDNTYYQFGEWENDQAMFNKWRHSRITEPVNSFLKSTQHYAIWDDHDFGPNDSHGDFKRKSNALAMFKAMWPNPSFGNDQAKGVFTKFTKGDAEFFLLDGRYNSIANLQMFGPEQIAWLKAGLLESKANFKFIITGTQLLPNNAFGEDWLSCPDERTDFLNFLEQSNIPGVILFSGDRHYTELNKMDRANSYPLYEYSCSPLTSYLYLAKKWNSKVLQKKTFVRTHNFGEIKLSGEGGNRKCTINTYNRKGQLIWTQDLFLNTLSH